MSETKPILPISIQRMAVTGKPESGKSLLGISFMPQETCAYDLEESLAPYCQSPSNPKGIPVACRIAVQREMIKLKPNGYKPIELFEWWYNDFRQRCVPGRYRVIIIDPISEIEEGLVEYVKNNPKLFGATPDQYAKMSGIMWGHAKAFWKSILIDLGNRTERDGVDGLLYLVTHLGQKYENNKPTGQMKPKGKSTISEVVSLFLSLRREVQANGAKPKIPSAIVLKSRLANSVALFNQETGEMTFDHQPILPPNLPEVSPAALRKWMLSPPDYSNLAPELLQPPLEKLTEDERLELELARAEAMREAEMAKLQYLSTVSDVQAQQAKIQAQQQAQDLKRDTATSPPATPATIMADGDTSGPITDDQVQQLGQLRMAMTELGVPDHDYSNLLAGYGVRTARDLHSHTAASFIAAVTDMVSRAREEKNSLLASKS